MMNAPFQEAPPLPLPTHYEQSMHSAHHSARRIHLHPAPSFALSPQPGIQAPGLALGSHAVDTFQSGGLDVRLGVNTSLLSESDTELDAARRTCEREGGEQNALDTGFLGSVGSYLMYLDPLFNSSYATEG